MIRHILLFKFRDGTPNEAINKIIDKFLECKSKLAGFTAMDYGPNVSTKRDLGRGFNYGIIMSFRDAAAIAEYNTLEEHKQAQQLQAPYVEEVLVFDIEIPKPAVNLTGVWESS
jgi:DNA primase